jgi:signal peptidase I
MKRSQGRRGVARALRSQAPGLAVAVGVALFLRAFVVEAFVIPSGSMIPTLEVGDRIFVDKSIYGLMLPLAQRKLTAGRMPERGEVAVFVPVDRQGDDLIKRVVAVGGDTVELRANLLVINGRAVSRRALPGPCTVDGEPCAAFEETLDGRRYRVLQHEGSPPVDFGPLRVPAGHVFLLGDNRDNSADSRAWGSLPREHLKGRALFVWFPGGPEGGRVRRFLAPVR